MLSPFQTIMLCMALAVAYVSRGNWRGLIWLGALILNYAISSQNWREDGPEPELVAGLCDAAVCIAIFIFAKRIWELWLWVIFLTSLLVNFLYLTHNMAALQIISHDAYATALEVLNLAALAIIGSVSAFMASGNTDGRAFHPWRNIFGLGRPFVGAVDNHDKETGG